MDPLFSPTLAACNLQESYKTGLEQTLQSFESK
jgi:hypothetical protein